MIPFSAQNFPSGGAEPPARSPASGSGTPTLALARGTSPTESGKRAGAQGGDGNTSFQKAGGDRQSDITFRDDPSKRAKLAAESARVAEGEWSGLSAVREAVRAQRQQAAVNESAFVGASLPKAAAKEDSVERNPELSDSSSDSQEEERSRRKAVFRAVSSESDKAQEAEEKLSAKPMNRSSGLRDALRKMLAQSDGESSPEMKEKAETLQKMLNRVEQAEEAGGAEPTLQDMIAEFSMSGSETDQEIHRLMSEAGEFAANDSLFERVKSAHLRFQKKSTRNL